MDKHEAKVVAEKEKTRRARIYEKVAVRVSLIIATMLLALVFVITFIVNIL